MMVVRRTVTVVGGESDQSRPLADFQPERAYVLLGDPGAGKSTAFETEVETDPDGLLVTARTFTRRSFERHPEWQGKTLFIDGLDEVRAGSRDARAAIDEILERLERLGSPKFRLSCRSADWLGRNDLGQIVSAAGYDGAKTLHLDPLGEEDVRAIATSLCGEGAEAFLAEASNRGLGGLLHNPHLLRLMVRAVRSGNWPDSRLATFEQACKTWVREHNEEHRAANRSAPPLSVEESLKAAGHLCALLLLSDREYASLDETGDAHFLPLSDVRSGGPEGYRRALHRALRSPLFVEHDDGGRIPAHRQTAEFLAARYLGTRIKSGLPASRALALMAGFDGVVVSELRGLAAWLAAFSASARVRLIETDPVGVALYGDVAAFEVDDRERLLRAFAERADEIDIWNWPEAALTSLVDSHTPRILAAYLAGDDRTEGAQEVVYLLLTAFSRTSDPLPADTGLVAAIRDGSWPRHVRSMALRALLRRREHDSTCLPALLSLLEDLRDRQIADRDHELLGLLLWHLYPDHIRPEEIWDYLLTDDLTLSGSYGFFWRRRFIEKTGNLAPQVVDALVRSDSEWRLTDADDRVWRVVPQLVYGALRAEGDEAAPARLFDWLKAIGLEEFISGNRSNRLSEVREWLASRPHVQKEVALEGLARYEGHEDYGYWCWNIRLAVFGAGTPDDFAAWCLRQAIEAADSHAEIARQLLVWSGPWRQEEADTGLSVTQVRAATAKFPALREEVERLASQVAAPIVATVREEEAEYGTTAERERAEVVSAAREQLEQLRDGTCNPALLNRLALAYHNPFDDQRGADPPSRLLELLDGDRELVQAALEGFRRVLDRDDLPSLRDLIRLDEKKRMSFFALPLLAGLDLLGPTALEGRNSDDVLRAVGLYYLGSVTLNRPRPPAWYDAARQSQTGLVAEALVKVTRSRIRAKKSCDYLWPLPRDEAYREVAQRAAPKLWRAFPTKCTEPQVSALRNLLRAGLRWRADGIAEALHQRLEADLDIAQRALWLSAGLFVSAEEHAPAVVSFVERGEEPRCRHIVDFLFPLDDAGHLPMEWETPVLQALITLVGSQYSPWVREPGPFSSWMGGDGRMRAERLILRLTSTLSARTDEASVAALQTLATDAALEAWHEALRQSLDEQVVARRSAVFSIPSLRSVQQALASGAPANAADLSALTVAALEEIACYVRDGNTDGWRQFWDESSASESPRPMHENRCRNRLLDALRPQLPPGVDAQPEGHYAEDKRADIRVSYADFAIPVEIKNNRHPRLWSAARDQLEANYTRDPHSRGYGIYLVLWFGRERTPTPPSGRRPETAEAFEQHLLAAVGTEHANKISAVVIDVSRPPGK